MLLVFASNILAITEQEFIKTVLSQDTHFEKDQIYVNIKQIELDASRQSYAGWNANLTASLDNSYYDVDKDTNSNGIYEKHRTGNKQSIGVSLEKRFLSNPSSLKLSVERSTPDSDITRYKKDTLYTTSKYDGSHSISTFDNNYQVSYKYPLLKHDDNASSFKTYQRNILDLEREKLDFYDAQERFLVDRLEQYLLWSLYHQRANVYQQYLQTLRGVKVIKSVDGRPLKTAILLANKDILENSSRLEAQKKSLTILLNDAGLSQQEPEIDDNKRPNIVTNKLREYLRTNVRILCKYAIDKQLKSIDLKYHENQSLVKLDFKIGAEQNTNRGNTLTTEYRNKSVNYFTNITLSMPIGDDVNNTKDIQVAKLNLKKLDIDYDNKLIDIQADVAALSTALLLNKKTLSSYKGVISSLSADVELMYDNYLNQSANVKDLIGAYQDRRDIELSYADSVIDYHQSLLQYNDKLDRVLPVN